MAIDKIPHLLREAGRYYYQRRVPFALQDIIGRKKWREPVGAEYLSAVDKVRELTKQHDTLIARLADPMERQDYKTAQRRKQETLKKERLAAEDDAYRKWLQARGLEDPGYFGEDPASRAAYEAVMARPWEWAATTLENLEKKRAPKPDVADFKKWVGFFDSLKVPDDEPLPRWAFPPFPEYLPLWEAAGERARAQIWFYPSIPDPMDDDNYHDELSKLYNLLFGSNSTPPSDPQERDEYDLAKQRLERKIARVTRKPDTITKVAERYYRFAQIRERTQDKYRRTIKRFTSFAGDLPLTHITPATLRAYRDELAKRGSLPSTVQADFTPIVGLLGYAVDEGLIEASPMASIKLPRDRRSIEESKWLPFEPQEMQRILSAVDEVWGHPLPGLTPERRAALQMVVRVLAFSAMRPSEVLSLRPDQVDNRCIRVEGGKTKSAWRVLPLHPEIRGFPSWLKEGGMAVLLNQKTGAAQTDPVTPVRHNFSRLIRDLMRPPITNQRKSLYSFRSSYQNALRRAGAPLEVRRAILGHVERGAIRHYDDGPEFELLKKWIERTDPRKPA